MANMANIIALINERLGRLESATQNQGQVNVDIGEMKLKKRSFDRAMPTPAHASDQTLSIPDGEQQSQG